jgi:vacuolar-type H+-ATPase subunit E/Vma4
METAIIPMVEKIADALQRQIKQIGERVDRELNEMREEIRAEIKRQRGGEVIDLPPSLRAGRNVN